MVMGETQATIILYALLESIHPFHLIRPKKKTTCFRMQNFLSMQLIVQSYPMGLLVFPLLPVLKAFTLLLSNFFR